MSKSHAKLYRCPFNGVLLGANQDASLPQSALLMLDSVKRMIYRHRMQLPNYTIKLMKAGDLQSFHRCPQMLITRVLGSE